MNTSARIIVAACIGSILAVPSLGAPLEGTGNVEARFDQAQAATHHHPVMVSILRDGVVVAQNEQVVPASIRFSSVKAGKYDVRAESDGAFTEVKRGVQVFADKTLDLQFVLRPGQGVHTVEYATGGLAREEVAARLARLEAAVTELQRAAQTHHN